MKRFLPVSGLIILSCLGYSCASRNTRDSDRQRKPVVTGITPSIKNPSRGVINASGDGLTPGIGKSNGAGSEENAANIANNAIARANAVVKNSPQNLAMLTDEELLNRMALSQQLETSLNIAVEKTISQSKIRDYAIMALSDYAKLRQELNKLSTQKNIVLVPGARLNISGKTDLEFVQLIIEGNQNLIALYNAASKSSDTAIREFALKQLPTLKKHLEAAQELTKVVRPKSKN